MQIKKLTELSKKEYQQIIQRSGYNSDDVTSVVREIMEAVKQRGDGALIEYYKKFSGEANYSINVSQVEIDEAYASVDKSFVTALQQMIKNIYAVNKAQLKKRKEQPVQTEQEVIVWREWRPIEKIGIYVPGGKAVYPSSLLMTAIPAQVAGCQDIVFCSPAKQDGKMPAATLVAADLLGLKRMYKVGGAEAIAAMTYGTETVPTVYKIFGPGNAYVMTAKMLISQTIAIDMPAGPSEVFIIADETANPAFIAADLLADGEHSDDSGCVLITTSQKIAEQTLAEIERQLPKLQTASRVSASLKKYGLIALADSLDESISFANEYAPEHLEIMTKNPEQLVKKITNAGSVFLGDFTAKATGDYATGATHVLPTGGMAKMYPPLGVDAFGKWMQVQKCTKEGLERIKDAIETVAEIEQLPGHKNSVSIRF